jgi:parallel beta-helix repeat protein
MMHKKVIAFTLTFLLLLGSASGMTRLATANFLPPPPELPHVYILSDGSISPQTLPIQHSGDLYTLTGDISDLTLEIQKEGIVLDGAGFTMHGNTSGTGILINGTKNITIQNLTLTSFRIGILIEQSSSNIITTNTLTNCEIGLHLNHAQNIQIINNHITANSQTAIVLYSFSCNNQIENNLINDNGNGIWCEFPGSYKGTNDDNKIIGNTIANNTGTAILLRGSANDWIQENNITGNQYGIGLSGSSCNYNTITQNNLVENREKNIDLSGDSKYNLITKNLIANSQVGLYIFNSNGSEIYLNNFIENQKQVDNDYVENFGPAVNFWDKDNQGNYWSDTANTTYVIDSSNIDHYPLNMPVSGVAIPEFSIWVLLAFFSVLTLFVLVLRKRGFRDVSVYCF